MKLSKYIKKFSIEDIINIEQQNDLQYVKLKNNYDNIIDKSNINKGLYLYGIIQCAIISYQLSGIGENWWGEFSENLTNDINSGKQVLTTERWTEFLQKCKNNRRFIANKLKRIEKISSIKNQISNFEKQLHFYNNMIELNNLVASTMSQKENAKTIVFATKMFGYGARIITNNYVQYPFELNIPIDSRIEKIYEFSEGKTGTTKQIETFFRKLSQDFNIPLLHLDSLLWIDYWYKFLKES